MVMDSRKDSRGKKGSGTERTPLRRDPRTSRDMIERIVEEELEAALGAKPRSGWARRETAIATVTVNGR